MIAVADSLRSDYYHDMNQESSHESGPVGRNSIETDTSQWLYPSRKLDNRSWPINQDATNWSALQNTYVNSMQDTHSHMNMNSKSSNTAIHSNGYQQQYQTSDHLPPLDVQWQQANDQGIAFDYSSILDHSLQQQSSHNYTPSSLSSSSHLQRNSSNAPSLEHAATSKLLQRRINGKQQSSLLTSAKPPAQKGDYYAQNDLVHLQSMHPGRSFSNEWSIDPNLCIDERSDWTRDNSAAMSPPRYLETHMQQQQQQASQYWMQRDRVHSQQSSADMTSPNTPSNGENSRPPSLINSSGLSLDSLNSPEYDFSPKMKMEGSFHPRCEDDSDHEDGKARIAKHRRDDKNGNTKKTPRQAPSYATLCRDSAAANAASSTKFAAKKNISKVVINKHGSIEGGSRSKQGSAVKETRHLCPFAGCDKHFSTSGHARRHSRIHASLRPFECPHVDCDATFTRRDNCSQHQKSRHRSQLPAHRLKKGE